MLCQSTENLPVCAPDDNSLNNIIEELTKRGFVYNE